MRRIVHSYFLLARAMIPAVILFAAAVSDPLHWLAALGIADSPDWVYPAVWRQSVCFALCMLYIGWWFHNKRLALDATAPVRPNMPLHHALRYIAHNSRWAMTYNDPEPGDWALLLRQPFMTALANGHVQVFGRRKNPNEYTADATTLIPINELGNVEWDYHLLFGKEPPMEFRVGGGVVYKRVMLNRSQVEREWPKRPLWHRWFRSSPIDRLNSQAKANGHDTYDQICKVQDKAYGATPYTASFIEIFQ